MTRRFQRSPALRRVQAGQGASGCCGEASSLAGWPGGAQEAAGTGGDDDGARAALGLRRGRVSPARASGGKARGELGDAARQLG